MPSIRDIGSDRSEQGLFAPILIFIIAEVRLYREGLEQILDQEKPFRVVGAAPSLGAALPLLRRMPPNVVLLDLAAEGPTAARALRHEFPEAKLVALAIREVEAEVLAWAEAGMAGYVSREASLGEVSATIRRAAAGELVCPPRITANLVQRLSSVVAQRPTLRVSTRLTAREVDVIRLIGQGLSNKEIARELCIALPTVKNHVHSVLEKLQVRRRGDAVSAMREGVWAASSARVSVTSGPQTPARVGVGPA
jgi:two-component system, NarL family, nitrate/nitrite response regulator NarL